MVTGSVHVRGLFYSTQRNGRISAKYYEDGYSQVQKLDTQNQRENAFKQAVSNASHKFAYHSKQRYDDIEYNYQLIYSEIVAIQPKTNKRIKQDDKLSGKDKRRLHREIKEGQKEYRDRIREEDYDKDKYMSPSELQREYKDNKNEERIKELEEEIKKLKSKQSKK